MSIISEQVKELRKATKLFNESKVDYFGGLYNEAADTIETLSAKLAKENMERSERYYNGGWILCSERLPEGENVKVIVSTVWDGYEYTTESYFYHGKFYSRPYYQIPAGKICDSQTGDEVIAWQPLPEPYKPK